MNEKLHVLLLEDNDTDAELAKALLRKSELEFSFKRVETKEDFTESLSSFNPDLILADYNLPSFDGLSALKIAKEKKPDIPFIILSGIIGDEIAVEFLKQGATDYLLKEKLSRLVPAIKRALEEKNEKIKLKNLEERFRNMMENMQEGCMLIGFDWTYIYMNEAAARHGRAKRADLIGRKMTELYPGVEKTPIFAAYKRCMETRLPQSVESEYTFQDNARGWFEIKVSPVNEGIFVLSSEITDRKNTERVAKEYAFYVRNLIETSLDPLITISLDGKIQDVNKATESVTGVSREQLIGTDFADYFVDREKAKEGYEHVFKEGFVKDYPLTIRHKTGKLTHVLYNASVYMSVSGQVQGVFAAARDITEQLKAQELIYRADLVDNVSDAIISTDGEFKIKSWNKAAEKIYGWTQEEVMGKNLSALLHSEYSKVSFHDVLKSLKEKGYIQIEVVHTHKNGTKLYVLSSITALRDESGALAGTIGIIHDFTERRKKEEELEKVNRMLRAINNSNQAMARALNENELLEETCRIIIEDCGYKMVWIGFAENDEKKSIRPAAHYGFEEGYLETLNLTWADSERGRGPTGTAIRSGKPAASRNMLTDPLFEPWREEALKRGYSSSIVFPLMNKDISFGAISIYSQEPDSFSEDEIKLLNELAGDLSRGIISLRLRKALGASEDELTNLYSTMTEGLAVHQIVYDASSRAVDYILVDVNPAFESIMGLTKKNVAGRKASEVYGTGEAPFLDIYSRVAETGKPETFEALFPPMKKFFNIAAFSPEKGKFATVFQDITESKKAEEVLKRDKETLESMVSLRTEELIKSYRELEKLKRLSDLGELAAIVAHELRNPLAAIGLANYNLQKKANKPELHKHFSTINKKVEESNFIINNLLSFSKIKQPVYEKIDIHALLDELVESERQKNQGKKIEIKDSYGPLKNLEMEGDSFQLKSVFANIINNAVDAMKEGGKLEIAGKNNKTSLLLDFRDNGEGIDAKNLDRIFEPFFSTKAKGTGLGLAVSKQIIELHNGNIGIESEIGKGTAVKIILPLKKTP